MNETDIRKYASLMNELGLTGLEITEDNKVVRLERTAPQAASEIIYRTPDADISPKAEADDGCESIRSTIVGVFYAAPEENADPYIKVGDHVKKGQTLCIIEAMKLMNEIVAEEDGTVVEVCVTNGQIVEFGTELFRIRR